MSLEAGNPILAPDASTWTSLDQLQVRSKYMAPRLLMNVPDFKLL